MLYEPLNIIMGYRMSLLLYYANWKVRSFEVASSLKSDHIQVAVCGISARRSGTYSDHCQYFINQPYHFLKHTH